MKITHLTAGLILIKRYHFSTLCDELQHFHSNSTKPLCDKTLIQSYFRWPIQSYVMSKKHSKAELCSTHEVASLLGQCFDIDLDLQPAADPYNVVCNIDLSYRLDTHDLKNGNAHATKRWKTLWQLHSSMNSALSLIAVFWEPLILTVARKKKTLNWPMLYVQYISTPLT